MSRILQDGEWGSMQREWHEQRCGEMTVHVGKRSSMERAWGECGGCCMHSRAPAFSSFVLGQHGERQPVQKTNPGEDRIGQKSLSSPVLELDRLGLES